VLAQFQNPIGKGVALKTEPSEKSSEMTIVLAKGAFHIRLYQLVYIIGLFYWKKARD
jgi:hypothetical protein